MIQIDHVTFSYGEETEHTGDMYPEFWTHKKLN